MRVSVDNQRCEAQARCEGVNAALFTLDDDGYSNIGRGKDVPAGQESDAETGVQSCPMGALSIDSD